jgi:hypothetical protein
MELRPLLPLALAAAAAGGSFLGIGREVPQVDWTPLLIGGQSMVNTTFAYGARTQWLAATYVLVVLSLVSLITVGESLTHVSRIAPQGSVAWRLFRALGAALCVAVVFGIGAAIWATMNGEGPSVLDIIESHDTMSVRGTFQLLNSAYPIGGLASAFGFAATLGPAMWRSNELVTLSDMLRRQRLILYTTSLVLASASVWMNVLWSWPQIWASSPELAKQIVKLSTEVSGSWGAIFTIYTLTVFSSAHLSLQAWVSTVARDTYPEVGERSKRLEELGLATTWAAELGKVTAILGPALVGGPGAMLLKAIVK